MDLQRQTLSLSQEQRLQMVLAPQLRQSLEMLQAPILQLRAMIQQEIEQNPTLEDMNTAEPSIEAAATTPEAPDNREELDFDKEFEALAKLDDEWRDYFFQDRESRPYTPDDARKRQFLLDSLPQKESLQEHLLKQLALTELPDSDRQIGELLIGSINEDGYLSTSLDDLAASAGYDRHHLEDVLAVIQDFHPTGVGARDLRECLLLQLERLGKADTLAAMIVRDHIEDLGAYRYPEIAKALKAPVEEVRQAAEIISTLDPKPGRIYSDEVVTYINPEVVVQKIEGRYTILLNDDELPHVRISKHYRELLEQKTTPPDVRSYIREKIKASTLLIRSIEQRQRTIYRIASQIVASQTDFLEHGVSHLKPLTMAEVAKVVGVHETTVSRAVSGKYIQTPKGVFEMKYFFTPGIRTSNGAAVSNKTVRDILAGLVGAEDPGRPLSDQELVEKLREQGIQIARRTIAKYRRVLRIPPSHVRRRL